MKTTTKKLPAVLLCVILTFGAAILAFAAEQPEVESTWQNTIESVTPVGDEPYVTLELTPTGYIFTDYAIPREYDVAFQDGTTERVRIPRKQKIDLFYDGNHVGDFFDVESGDETITLYACIIFNAETKQSRFELGQALIVPEEYEGDEYEVYYYFLISGESCRTEIDDSSMIARVLYPIFSMFNRILRFFSEIRYKMSK